MKSFDLDRAWVLVALIAFFSLAMVLPIVRQRLRTGDWGVTFFHNRDPVQRAMGIAFALATTGCGVWGLLYAMVPPEVLGIWAAPAWISVIGALSIALGFAIVIVAQAEMGASWRIGIDHRPTALVTGGIYRFVRNPIYAGLGAMVLGLVLVTPSVWSAAAGLATFLVVEVQTRLEERHLKVLHGAEYLRWASRTGRFLPLIGRL